MPSPLPNISPEFPETEKENLLMDMEMVRHVMSHDLLNPLRALMGTSEQLWQKYNGELDEIGRNQLFSIIGSSKKLHELHQATLEFIRIGLGEVRKKPVSGNDIIKSTMENLSTLIAQTGATVSIESIPDIYCRRAQIIKLFTILIENAIKFTSDGIPEVKISWSQENGFHKFIVEDKGVGIPEEYQEIIFVLFQRVPDTNQRQAGVGAGLSLARKIVEAHGGSMWVESEPGNGSKFFFKLPIQESGGNIV